MATNVEIICPICNNPLWVTVPSGHKFYRAKKHSRWANYDNKVRCPKCGKELDIDWTKE